MFIDVTNAGLSYTAIIYLKNKPMKVIFHKLYPYAPYLNEYIGIEEEFPSTTDQEVFDGYVNKLRDMAENNHKSKYPHLYTDNQVPQPSFDRQEEPYIPPNPKDTISLLIEEMNKCTEITKKNKLGVEEGLMFYADKFIENERFTEAFHKKMNELKNK